MFSLSDVFRGLNTSWQRVVKRPGVARRQRRRCYVPSFTVMSVSSPTSSSFGWESSYFHLLRVVLTLSVRMFATLLVPSDAVISTLFCHIQLRSYLHRITMKFRIFFGKNYNVYIKPPFWEVANLGQGCAGSCAEHQNNRESWSILWQGLRIKW